MKELIQVIQEETEIESSCILTKEAIRELRKNPNCLSGYYWSELCRNKILSEEFIREFKDYVNWYYVSSSQSLSENFIREFKDSVDWRYIGIRQNLSKEFIYEFYDKVDWPELCLRLCLLEWGTKVKTYAFQHAPSHVKLYIALNHRELLEYFT